jgi:hypothetical protein
LLSLLFYNIPSLAQGKKLLLGINYFQYPYKVFTIVYAWFIIGGKKEIIGGKRNANREDYDKDYCNKNHHHNTDS